MERCNCGSYALNISPESGLCDVCHFKHRAEKAEAEVERLTALLTEVYKAAIQVPVVYRGDALRLMKLCDRMLDELGEDPITTATRE